MEEHGEQASVATPEERLEPKLAPGNVFVVEVDEHGFRIPPKSPRDRSDE
jgi:hypothetical protein